jgi:hypothetical protein
LKHTASAEESDESASAPAAMLLSRWLRQLRALARYRTPAEMLCEPLYNVIVNIPPKLTRKAQPARKMFGFRVVPAPTDRAVSLGTQVLGVVTEV